MPFITEAHAEEKLALSRALNASTTLAVINPLRVTNMETNHNRFTETERILFGVLGKVDGIVPAATALGVNKNTVESSMNGKFSGRQTADPELKAKVDSAVTKFRDRLQNLVSTKISNTIERITDEKLDEVKKASELAMIASSLSKVSRDLEPAVGVGNGTAIQFNIFRPRTRNEDEYDVVEVMN